MEFVNRTVYSYDLLLRFNNFFAKSKKLMWIFMIGFDILITVIFCFDFIMYGFDSQMILYMILILAITATYIIMMLVVPKFSLKKSKLLDAVCTFTFTDEQFEINAESSYSSENASLKYSALYKVMEDDQCFYLFRTKNQANVIDKDGFVTGNITDFREFLRGKIEPKKFKCK